MAGPLAVSYTRFQKAQSEEPEADGDDGRKAICVMDPSGDSGASGIVYFDQPNFYSKIKISGEFKGMKPGLHGFHIHQFGNLTKGCTTAGPHYNPFGKEHGGPDDEERHVGDLGNVVAIEDGTGKYYRED